MLELDSDVLVEEKKRPDIAELLEEAQAELLESDRGSNEDNSDDVKEDSVENPESEVSAEDRKAKSESALKSAP